MAVASIVVLLAVARDITVPLALGIFLAVVFAPIVDWLEDKGVKGSGGSLIVLVGLVVVF